MTDDEIRALTDKQESAFSLPRGLLYAIIMQESGGDPYAVRYELGYRWLATPEVFANHLKITKDTEVILQSCSWGLFQIMGATARSVGFDGSLPKLCDPEIGSYYGAKYLAQLSRHFKGDLNKTIAAYNGGIGAVKSDGSFSNQGYVTKVLARLK